MRILALLALGVDLVAANSYTPPLQLHPCSATAADQQFTIESNETTVYSPIPWSPDYELGYCLDIVNNGTTEGTLVQAANCDQKGCRNPGACANQLWAVRGSTIASLQPKTPFCLGVKVPAQGSQHGQLMNCNDSSAQFRTPAAGSTGPVVHVASSLCLTVGRCAAPSPPPQATAAAGTAAPTGNASCDIYSSAGNPCVSAHSMVRALYGAYAGRLYRVILFHNFFRRDFRLVFLLDLRLLFQRRSFYNQLLFDLDRFLNWLDTALNRTQFNTRLNSFNWSFSTRRRACGLSRTRFSAF